MEGSEFSRAMHAYTVGILKREQAPTVDMIADWLCMTPCAVYKKLENEGGNTFKVDEFVKICRMSGGYYRPVLRWLVGQCDPALSIYDVGDSEPDGSFSDDKDGIMIALGEMTQFLKDAVADGKLTAQEHQEGRAILDGLLGRVQGFIGEFEEYRKTHGV